MKRDLAGGREYQRLRTTYYMYNIYDMVNDSRFWKSFKTKYAVNNPKAGSGYEVGDLGVMYVVNRPGDTRFDGVQLSGKVIDEKTGKAIPTTFVTYPKDRNGKDDVALYDDVSRFVALNKYIDGSRETVSDMGGNRDGILAHLGETYLIAADLKEFLENCKNWKSELKLCEEIEIFTSKEEANKKYTFITYNSPG